MALFMSSDPFPNSIVFGCVSDAPAASAYNQVSRPVFGIGVHAFDGAAMDDGVGGNVASLAFGQGPADGFPAAVFLQVHTPEGQVLHHVPRHDAHAASAVVELENVVDAALGRGNVKMLVEARIWEFLVVGENIFVVGVASDAARCVCVAIDRQRRGRVNFNGWYVVVRFYGAIYGVFMAAVQSYELLLVEFEASLLRLTHHPDKGYMTKRYFAFYERPASTNVLCCVSIANVCHRTRECTHGVTAREPDFLDVLFTLFVC